METKTMNKQEVNKKYPKRNGFYYFDVENKEVVLPSITKILQVLNKPFLIPWAAKKCAAIALDNPTLTEDEVYTLHRNRDVIAAGTRGTGIHNIAPKLIKDINADYLEVYEPYIKGLKKFIQEHKPEEMFSEKVVKSFKYGIAGQFDWLLNVKGEAWLVDIKTSAGIYPEHGLQLAFYEQALLEEGIKVDKRKILHLPGNGKYSLVEVGGSMEVISHIKKVWEWANGR